MPTRLSPDETASRRAFSDPAMQSAFLARKSSRRASWNVIQGHIRFGIPPSTCFVPWISGYDLTKHSRPSAISANERIDSRRSGLTDIERLRFVAAEAREPRRSALGGASSRSLFELGGLVARQCVAKSRLYSSRLVSVSLGFVRQEITYVAKLAVGDQKRTRVTSFLSGCLRLSLRFL